MQHFSKSTWAASGCTGCHHCHYHSSKMKRTLDTNQRTKSQTCHTCRVLSIYIPRPAEIDSQQLQQMWCENNFLLASGYQIQPAPSPTKWIGKANKYEFNRTTSQKLAKHQLTRRDQWPATCFVEPGPKLPEMESLMWPPCILWTN